ncbi:hypothetical protein BKA67DRAFT_320436 [Truncatella angustata]|uniref:Zn(2)-C6 fungal-type domain-containing protein n=1 Tax=Truncatella angustata TaxID=152316 RepID=A0A9P8ZW90_9PEZI|nr:uncharacterized protein BKA67DRAFT_320436 [Truncatella angustata]KAH6653415.1 hypothetical protein BKA67DRAFT_320436 [Truncatella angustata]
MCRAPEHGCKNGSETDYERDLDLFHNSVLLPQKSFLSLIWQLATSVLRLLFKIAGTSIYEPQCLLFITSCQKSLCSSTSKSTKMKTTTSSLITAGKTTTQQYSEQEKPYPYTRKSRIQRACEKCKQKKTRCDGALPCKKCKEHNYICVTTRPSTTKYKQVPAGYAEALENCQLTLVNTIHELYSMVRNGKSWDLGEPEINDQGQPLVHNIATLLGCVRSGSPMSVHTPLPQDETGLAELAAERQARQTDLQVAGEIQQETDAACRQHPSKPLQTLFPLVSRAKARFEKGTRNNSCIQGWMTC